MFGPFETVALESPAVRIVACPALGGRILSLVDRARDREWLVAGDPPHDPASWATEAAVFDGAVAFGWDECLPTVAPCPDPLDGTAPPLRDHGDQWGRPADTRLIDGELVTEFAPGRWRYRFSRRLVLDGAAVVATYRIENGDRRVPFLWSMHALLALEAGAEVRLDRAGASRVTSRIGPIAAGPRAGNAIAARYEVPPGMPGSALKAYARLDDPGTTLARQPDGATLRMTWDREVAPVAGLWLDFGGWPADGPLRQVAIEPTTSEDDDLASALGAARARWLESGASLTWWVRMALE